MKKSVIAATAFIIGLCASAQESGSMQYLLEEFTEGVVVYSDGQFRRGLINISTMDQLVYLLSPEGELLEATDISEISSVSMGGRVFYKWRNYFAESVAGDAGCGVGVVRSTSRIRNASSSAYGAVNQLSSIDTYQHRQDNGTLRTDIIDNPLNYNFVVSPCLYKDGKFYDVTKKSFIKIFPEKKAYIESIWDERKNELGDPAGVIALFNELKDSAL